MVGISHIIERFSFIISVFGTLTFDSLIAMCIRFGKQGIWRDLGSANRLSVQLADDNLASDTTP